MIKRCRKLKAGFLLGSVFVVAMLLVARSSAAAETEGAGRSDTFTSQALQDILKSKRFTLENSYRNLENKDLEKLGDLKDSWFPELKRLTVEKDPIKIINYMKPVVERYPYNLATYGAYGNIALAYRSLGNESEANKWLRKNIESLDVLVERHKDKLESIQLIRSYEILYGLLSDITEEEYEREKQIFLSNLSRPLFADYKDTLLYSLAKAHVRRSEFQEALKVLEQMDEFYETQPSYEKNRLHHDILRAQCIYELGKTDEAIAVLESTQNDPWGTTMDNYVDHIIREINGTTKTVKWLWPVQLRSE